MAFQNISTYYNVKNMRYLESTIQVRISSNDRELIENACKIRGEALSTFTRRALKKELAILGIYNEGELKILGIKIQDEENNK